MNLKLSAIAVSALFNHKASAAMDHDDGDDMASVYCAKQCSSDNPCGDNMGQSPQCLSITFDNATKFGFQDANQTDTFLGCAHSVCTSACSGMQDSSKMDIVNGTFCFPKMTEMNDMFMTEDLAKMAAVSRGCEGAHLMDDKFMIGDTHMACMKSYSKSGVALGSEDSSSSSVMKITFGAIASGFVALVFNTL